MSGTVCTVCSVFAPRLFSVQLDGELQMSIFEDIICDEPEQHHSLNVRDEIKKQLFGSLSSLIADCSVGQACLSYSVKLPQSQDLDRD